MLCMYMYNSMFNWYLSIIKNQRIDKWKKKSSRKRCDLRNYGNFVFKCRCNKKFGNNSGHWKILWWASSEKSNEYPTFPRKNLKHFGKPRWELWLLKPQSFLAAGTSQEMHTSAARKLNGKRDKPDLRKTPFQRTFISFTSGARKFIEAFWIFIQSRNNTYNNDILPFISLTPW